MMRDYSPSKFNVYMTLILVQVLFGINFVTSKIVLKELSPYVFASTRFLIAGVVLLIYCLLKKFPMPTLDRSFVAQVLILSATGISLSQTLFLKGLEITTSINTSIICTTIPIFTLLVVIFRRQAEITIYKVVGFIFAFFGVGILKNFGDLKVMDSTLLGDLLVLSSCVILAIYISYCRDFFKKYDPYWGSALLFICGGVYLLPFVFNNFSTLVTCEFSNVFVGALSFTIIFATLLNYFFSNWALRYVNPDRVALFIYLQPVMAALFAWKFLGEEISVRSVGSIILILFGMLFGLIEVVGTSSKEG